MRLQNESAFLQIDFIEPNHLSIRLDLTRVALPAEL
jgi:hypothetical protein